MPTPPSTDRFDVAFDRVISAEGGYVNNPADPGGETQWGISKRAYPNVDIKALTRDDAKAIYRRDYWDALSLDAWPFAEAFQLFDFAVNSGVGAIKKILPPGGFKGDQVVLQLLAARLTLMTSAPGWPTFGKGWARRVAACLAYAAHDLQS